MSTDFLEDIEKIYHPIFYIYNYFGNLKLYLGSLYKCHHSEISKRVKIRVVVDQNCPEFPPKLQFSTDLIGRNGHTNETGVQDHINKL